VEVKGHARFAFSGFWLSSESSDVRVVAHYRDVTKQRVLEERLRESERLAALGQLAAGAAHEINNPLGFLTSNLNSLKDSLVDLREIQEVGAKALALLRTGQGPEAQRALEEMEELDGESLVRDGSDMIAESLEGARRVGDIVRALRELSRFGVERADPCAVNTSVARVGNAEFGDHSPALVLDLHAQRKAQIPPIQLDQSLSHVLRNARLAISGDQKVRVRTEDLDSHVLIEVRDEGCGISPENLRRIFEPFFTTRGVGQGIGLGLTAAYGIITRNGGTIDVQSAIGKGTTVTVKLLKSKMEDEPAPLEPVALDAGA
jgi:signal transduction histidine kinase